MDKKNSILLVVPISNLEVLEELKEVILREEVLVRVVTDEKWEQLHLLADDVDDGR